MVSKPNPNKIKGEQKFSQRTGSVKPEKHGEKLSLGFGTDGSGGYNKNYDKRGVNGFAHGTANKVTPGKMNNTKTKNISSPKSNAPKPTTKSR